MKAGCAVFDTFNSMAKAAAKASSTDRCGRRERPARSAKPKRRAPDRPDIIDSALAEGSFQTLARALATARLVDVLKTEGPFTVFAPTDEAFAALPEGTVESLLEPGNRSRLEEILKLHVVSGKVLAADAAAAGTAETLQGSELTFEIADGRLKVDGSAVTASDIEAGNGVIHVIDRVLLPE